MDHDNGYWKDFLFLLDLFFLTFLVICESFVFLMTVDVKHALDELGLSFCTETVCRTLLPKRTATLPLLLQMP